MPDRPLSVAPVPALAGLAPYTIGRPADVDLVLDFNESLSPLPEAAARPGLADLQVHRYPDQRPLEAALAARLDLDPASVVVTNGADDALERCVRSVCAPGRRAVLCRPSYGMIRRFALLAGAEVIEVPWWRGDLPVDDIIDHAGRDAALVAVVSPNNPTGAAASRASFERLVTTLSSSLILLDQAYLDFSSSEHDLTDIALAHPNVVIVRTLSKAWGGAGLRAGYAVADPRVADWLRRVGLPFPVSSPTVAAALSLVQDGGGPGPERIERILRERAALTELLDALGAEPLPSEGSFVLARFADPTLVWRGLAALGIAIRAFPGRAELDGWLRFTLPGDEAAFQRLCESLRVVVAPEAVLFDLDGVLADVSRSYREAVIRTAASYGVELGSDEIIAAKTAGDANNDWELTCRLLRAHGVDAALDEVTERFESLYQGTDDRPGLRRRESLLVPPAWLERLASDRPLGVVTGRPAADAERFLSDHGVRHLISALVTMDDAAIKPDPAPVRLALDRLGVRRAWMVGDTVDDVRAARAAGVLPVGVVAPGDPRATVADALLGAGAAVVLPSTDALTEVLS